MNIVAAVIGGVILGVVGLSLWLMWLFKDVIR